MASALSHETNIHLIPPPPPATICRSRLPTTKYDVHFAGKNGDIKLTHKRLNNTSLGARSYR